MHAWESIQKTLEHIEKNIKEDIEIESLAEIASLSLFYYQRLFTKLVKKPVREYIKLRRLARASKSLKDKNSLITDIAHEFGFNCHDTFTRAFKESYGFTPTQYRNHPVSLNHFEKPDLLLGHVMIDEGVPLISDGLVLEINRKTLRTARKYLGLQGHVSISQQIPLGEKTGVDIPGEIWRYFHQEKNKIPRKPGGHELGVAHMGDAPTGCFTYFAGAEVEAHTDTHGFQSWTLPAQNYIVCGFEAETFDELVSVALDKAQKYTGTWLEKHGMAYGPFSAEMYYDGQPEGSYMEIWAPYTEVKNG